MTTLPQTTNVRLPQVASGQAPVAYVPSAGAAGSPGMSGADIWRVVRTNLWLMVIFVLLFGAGGYVLNSVWASRWPRYRATGLLQLRTTIPSAKPGEPGSDRDIADARLVTELRTQAQLLTQDALFSSVLTNRDEVRKTAWFRQFRQVADAKEDLRDNFRASPLADSTLLSVQMTCADPRDAKTIVEEIVKEHLAQQERIASGRVDGQTKTLGDMLEKYTALITQQQNTVRDLQATLTRKGAGGGNLGIISSKGEELKSLYDARLKLEDNANLARSSYDRVKDLNDKGQDIPEVEKAVDNDPTVLRLSADLANMEIQLEVAKTQRGEQHPEVARIKAMVESTQNKLDEQKQRQRISFRNQIMSVYEAQRDSTVHDLESIQKQIDKATTDLADLSREVLRFQTEQDLLKAYQELYQQYRNRFDEIRTAWTPQNQMRIEWATQPEIPDVPTWPKLWIILPMAIMLGLGLATGIAFLREYLDDTVRSPRDITRVGQMNVLGIVADADEDPQVANARLPIFDAPHSVTAEQFRQIRTRLQHIAGVEANRSLMVTGPSPLDGKTTVAANLAAALALNGRKTLLVDANVRRPEVHRLFGVGNEKGFSDVLNGTTAFDEALRPTRIPNLTIMASGPKPMNPTELFESQLLVDFIERALEEYDHVIFDSGPFLVVSEPGAMAPRVDGVITVVRAHEESRGLLQRMRDQLKQVKAEHVGVVVNAVRSQGGGYYRRNIKAYYNYNGA